MIHTLTPSNFASVPSQAHRRRGRGLLDTLKAGAKTGLALSKSMGGSTMLKNHSNPYAKLAGSLLEMAGGRKHRKGRKVYHRRR
jgi:hypothetical protein